MLKRLEWEKSMQELKNILNKFALGLVLCLGRYHPQKLQAASKG